MNARNVRQRDVDLKAARVVEVPIMATDGSQARHGYLLLLRAGDGSLGFAVYDEAERSAMATRQLDGDEAVASSYRRDPQ